ncbi:hypothetical protein HPB47_022788 [Ixodes persulcatus]|uniref:Uncharacterized protein n=1 Tax=Ixodes persulcatus TaxID=34615 RepID=A0AC60QB14_IXOPE|nr:hypothetical protein HPB47_022788 [Ixodes persulcatus]
MATGAAPIDWQGSGRANETNKWARPAQERSDSSRLTWFRFRRPHRLEVTRPLAEDLGPEARGAWAPPDWPNRTTPDSGAACGQHRNPRAAAAAAGAANSAEKEAVREFLEPIRPANWFPKPKTSTGSAFGHGAAGNCGSSGATEALRSSLLRSEKIFEKLFGFFEN